MPAEMTSIINIAKQAIFYTMILANLATIGVILYHWVQYGQGKPEAGQNIARALIALGGINAIWLILYVVLSLTGATDIANTLK